MRNNIVSFFGLLRNIKIKPFFRWYDLWIGIYIDIANQVVYICLLPMVGVKVYFDSLSYWGWDDDNDHYWLCVCGHYEESAFHCSECGYEPPWGCDCSFCDEKRTEDYYDEYYYDGYPGPWDQ